MKRTKRDLFYKTRRSLTAKYSLLIILFLMLFIIILFSFVYFWFLSAERSELRDRVRHEAELVEEFFLQDPNHHPGERNDNQEFVTTDSDPLFYYVLDTRGELVLNNEQLPLLKTAFINFIKNWKPEKEELRKEEFILDRKLFIKNEKNKDNRRFSTYIPKDPELQILMIARPIYDHDQLVGYLYIGENITDLLQLLKRLFIILAFSALIFSFIAFAFSRVMSNRAMVPIERAFKRQQEFVADASHELRTPLSVMLSSLDILEMEDEEKNEISAKMVGNLKDEVKRMSGLVGDLLTLARSDSDDPNISFEDFNLRPIAERTIHTFEGHAASKNIQLELDISTAITIFGNKDRITQLLYILLDNAIKYSKESGSVTLSITMEKNLVTISVKDNGIGIDEKNLTHIFERFYRVDKARTRQQGGHGLGLSIAKWIVDIHGGRISVESKIGEGSTFIVKIPSKTM
ncbi:sensor histidine kinase [Metabacillus sediminilitoris]|uniref:histidine kinase n=1 Tax=Metabacillus sediminilitoris TaxID=2567941 RepID=A0A4S4C089_9BACI|nr:ATP-binding protein [Metabacillus sediminilitoris]QGQ47935.1 GHKL domain-containing protein [Metabacillus sediminilitoris]THF80951.1 cell wall metabolism sensor histidine kinase WalK [Metabacillus sediminilitoris]